MPFYTNVIEKNGRDIFQIPTQHRAGASDYGCGISMEIDLGRWYGHGGRR
jgi:hypothetical protein